MEKVCVPGTLKSIQSGSVLTLNLSESVHMNTTSQHHSSHPGSKVMCFWWLQETLWFRPWGDSEETWPIVQATHCCRYCHDTQGADEVNRCVEHSWLRMHGPWIPFSDRSFRIIDELFPHGSEWGLMAELTKILQGEQSKSYLELNAF